MNFAHKNNIAHPAVIFFNRWFWNPTPTSWRYRSRCNNLVTMICICRFFDGIRDGNYNLHCDSILFIPSRIGTNLTKAMRSNVVIIVAGICAVECSLCLFCLLKSKKTKGSLALLLLSSLLMNSANFSIVVSVT